MGTTLDILAPYLRRRPEAHCPHGTGRIERLYTDYQFPGDSRLEEAAGIWEELEPGGTRSLRIYRMRDITPVLYSYKDLTKQLNDASVPAIEVAKLAYENVVFDTLDWTKVEVMDYGHNVAVRVPSAMDNQWLYTCSINEEWEIKTGDDPACTWQIVDYLRSKYFAVGLTPDQYIRKDV